MNTTRPDHRTATGESPGLSRRLKIAFDGRAGYGGHGGHGSLGHTADEPASK